MNKGRGITMAVLLAAFSVAGVSSGAAQDKCPYDTTGDYTYDATRTPTYLFFGDGAITYDGTTVWYLDDVMACYNSYTTPGYLIYFPKCDIDGDGSVSISEVYDIYYRVHPQNQSNETVQLACAEAFNRGPFPFCTVSRYNRANTDINAIAAQYPATAAVLEGQTDSLGQSSVQWSYKQLLCTTPGVFPQGVFDGLNECYLGSTDCQGGTCDVSFSQAVDPFLASAEYSAVAQSYGGVCEMVASGWEVDNAPGFHFEIYAPDNKFWIWEVRATAECVGNDCECNQYYKFYTHVDYPGSVWDMDAINSSTPNCTDARFPAGTGTGKTPTDVTFQTSTIRRVGGRGDNWCLTWAADDTQVTSMCDGDWFNVGTWFHNKLYRIVGEAADFDGSNISSYPEFTGGAGSWFGYGIVSVDGVLYSAISKTPWGGWSGPFRGIKLLKSPDNGATWYRVDRYGNERPYDGPHDAARNVVSDEEMFFLEEYGEPHVNQVAYPFSFIDFVQCGRDNSAAQDDYLYIYSPEGARSHELLLARVHRDQVGNRSAWEYFNRYESGQPVWTSDIEQRSPAHVFPEQSNEGYHFGWYSWLPSVVWNEGLGLYIMVNGGTYAGYGATASDEDYYNSWMHQVSGSLGFWYSEKPYGPWTQFYYTDYWVADHSANLTYQPKLSPKWISADGTEMVLIWSDAMKDANGASHAVNYTWNQMNITLSTIN